MGYTLKVCFAKTLRVWLSVTDVGPHQGAHPRLT